MIIKVDQEAYTLLENLCDLALKIGGIKNLSNVVMVLNKMKLLPEAKEKPKEKKPDKK